MYREEIVIGTNLTIDTGKLAIEEYSASNVTLDI